MSERFLCGDPAFVTTLVMDDLNPLGCTGIRCVNKSGRPVDFAATIAGKLVAMRFDADTDSVLNLPATLPVVATRTFKGTDGWIVDGLTDFYVRQGRPDAASSLPLDLSGGDTICNVTAGIARDARQGTPIAMPGTVTKNPDPIIGEVG